MNELITFFLVWITNMVTLLIPVALAWIAWRQRVDGQQINIIKKDVEVVKAVGNSTLREAMAATVQATVITAAVTGSEDAKIAAEVAKQRLNEHDVGQAQGRQEPTIEKAIEVKKAAEVKKEEKK